MSHRLGGVQEHRTRAWVICLRIARAERRAPERARAEALALARALPALDVVGAQTVHMARRLPGALFGTGKRIEIGAWLTSRQIALVLVDGPLSPIQQRNLEREWGVKVLDRTGLILEIFAHRAATREGVLQVEMAALTYQRSRLVRAWTHLERQRGGLGFVGGPGETQIEADRRAIDTQLVRLRKQLGAVGRTRALRRESRKRTGWPVIALVGYTNVGKSTLFNQLSHARALACDMPFATLDPMMRIITLPQGQKALLLDSVGFISDLPTQLVAAFRATLEELFAASMLIHVRDVSSPGFDEEALQVERILDEIGVDGAVPRLELWNKSDLLRGTAQLHAHDAAHYRPDVVLLSAKSGTGLKDVRHVIARALLRDRQHANLFLPFDDGRRRAWLFDQGVVQRETMMKAGIELGVCWTADQAARFSAL